MACETCTIVHKYAHSPRDLERLSQDSVGMVELRCLARRENLGPCIAQERECAYTTLAGMDYSSLIRFVGVTK